MPSRQLIQAMLVVHFSGKSHHPFVNACQRIGIGLLASIIFGLLFAGAIRRAILPLGLPNFVIFTVTLSIGFIISGLMFLAISSNETINSKSNSFGRIIKMLPLSKFSRWLVMAGPSLIIISIIGSFGAILIVTASQIMLVSPLFSVLGWSLGLLSGYGCLLLKRPLKPQRKALLFIATVVINGLLFDKVINIQSNLARNAILIIICSWLLIMNFGHYQLYKEGRIDKGDENQDLEKALMPGRIPFSGWFLVKIWRNKRLRSSFIIALTLSVSGALSILVRNKAFSDPYQIVLFGAILSATFACDIRGVMDKYSPPEIVLLSGIKGIVRAEVLSVIACGLIIGFPMYSALLRGASNFIVFSIYYVAVQIFSSIIGLLASTLLVPSSSDTGSQFMAALVAISAIFMVPKVGKFSEVTYSLQFIYWLSAALLCIAVIYITEITRRRRHGRT